MTTLSASVPAQAALADYLHHGGYDKHLRRLRHALESQGAQLAAAVARHFPKDVRISRPDGGYFLWVEFAPGFDTLALHQRALEQGISIAPGPIFSARRAFAHCVRLNFGHPFNERIDAAVQVLGRLARDA
jgi:DNA-binding transcriptional MocR family regulator